MHLVLVVLALVGLILSIALNVYDSRHKDVLNAVVMVQDDVFTVVTTEESNYDIKENMLPREFWDNDNEPQYEMLRNKDINIHSIE